MAKMIRIPIPNEVYQKAASFCKSNGITVNKWVAILINNELVKPTTKKKLRSYSDTKDIDIWSREPFWRNKDGES